MGVTNSSSCLTVNGLEFLTSGIYTDMPSKPRRAAASILFFSEILPTSVPTKPKTELAKTPFCGRPISRCFFVFWFVFVEVPHARMRKVSGFSFFFLAFPLRSLSGPCACERQWHNATTRDCDCTCARAIERAQPPPPPPPRAWGESALRGDVASRAARGARRRGRARGRAAVTWRHHARLRSDARARNRASERHRRRRRARKGSRCYVAVW